MARVRWVLSLGAATASVLVAAAAQVPPSQPTITRSEFRFHHVHLNVVDPDRSIAYYTDAFTHTKRARVAGWDALKSERAYLLFNKVATPAPAELDTALWHFGWNAPDLMADYRTLVANGIAFYRAPPTSSGHTITPDGNDVELVQGTGRSGGSAAYGFNHVHLMSAAPICAARWYRRVFGLQLAAGAADPGTEGDCEIPFSGRSEPGNIIRQPNTRLLMPPDDVLLYLHPNQNPAQRLVPPVGRVLDHIAFTHPDITEALAAVERQGVRVIRGMHSFGDTDLKAAMVEGPDRMTIELVERPPDPPPTKRVLFLTHAAYSFRHSSLEPAEQAVTELGERGGFEVTALRGYEQEPDELDLSMISAEYLAQFDGLIMMTNGELPLTDSQKAALVDFVRGGKAFIALHNAPATLFTYRPFGEMVGGYFLGTFSAQARDPRPAVLRVEDPNHPATRMLGDRWTVRDEFYQFAPESWDPAKPDENVANGQRIPLGFSRDNVHVLLSLDPVRTDMSNRGDGWSRGGDYPQAWYHMFGRGRAIYTSIGHRDELWESDALFRAHVLGAIRWALGLEN